MELPVFYDGTGRRWRNTKLVLLVLAVLVLGLTAWLAPKSLAQERAPELQRVVAEESGLPRLPGEPSLQGQTASEVSNRLNHTNLPTIGQGPLVRLVQLVAQDRRAYAVDPFSGKTVSQLPEGDVTAAGLTLKSNVNTYALQRYGATGNNHRIALTFDDGPDPRYTPALLDILSREKAEASFFMLGNNLARHPEIAQRIVREGHTVANHSFTHIDFNYYGTDRAVQEINQTQRVLRAATGRDTPYFRPPYGGNTEQSYRNGLTSIIQAQQLGYTLTSYDFDALDWQFPNGRKPTFPVYDGRDIVVLVHDAGGRRDQTVTYVQAMITQAKAAGYSFVDLDTLYGQPASGEPAAAGVADTVSLHATRAVLVWPRRIIVVLFVISVVTLLGTTLLNVVLAYRQSRRSHYKRRPNKYLPSVTVIVPAYNEGAVLRPTVRSILASRYSKLRVLIVDDGSTDDTWRIARQLARRHKRVSALTQPNGGKSSALNRGIRRSRSEIIICVDADTVFLPQTVTRLIRHFHDPSVGAVAGVVKVGNIGGFTTRWQALEYAIGISIERNAQAFLRSVMIVPGACGAWRRQALRSAGGFSTATLAEDCDVTLQLHRQGWQVLHDNTAWSYTEAPATIRTLAKQRFRWTFGMVQSLYKHRGMFFRRQYGWLGMLVMPAAVLTTAMPLVFWPMLIFVNVQNLLAGNILIILVFLAISLSLQAILAFIGVRLAGEPARYVLAVPYGRLVYGPVRTYILFRMLLTVLRGATVGWNKLARLGTVKVVRTESPALLAKTGRS